MITVENILLQYPLLKQEELPQALKQEEFEFITENIDLYNEDETIKKYIDLFVSKLNELVSKNDNSHTKKEHKKTQRGSTLKLENITPIIKKFMPKFQIDAILGSEEHFEIIQKLETQIRAIPTDTRSSDQAYEKAKKNQKANYLDFYRVYAHYFYGGSDWYVLSWDKGDLLFCYVVLNGDTQMSEMGDVSLTELHANNVELDFFWNEKQLSSALYEAFPEEFPKPAIIVEDKGKESKTMPIKNDAKIKDVDKKQNTHTKSIIEENTVNVTPVEKLDISVSFIKRYLLLHDKTKDKNQILNFLNALQKAIIEKRIRKSSLYATEIENIQRQIIKCYNQMGSSIRVSLDNKTIKAYSQISDSEKVMLSILYIKTYIGLHGKTDIKEKAILLHHKIERALELNKITKDDPYFKEIEEIQLSLKKYIANKLKSPIISESTLNGILSLAGSKKFKYNFQNCKCKGSGDNLSGASEPENIPEPSPSLVISSVELAGMNFETIGLQGKYRELIGDPSVGFSAMVFGLPKSGKSTLCIDFAKHLAENHGKVLYVAIEEGFGYTLKEKFERLGAIHPNLVISESIPLDLSPFQYVFIDSVSKAGLSSEDLTTIRKDNPKTAFIFIFHTTKAGNFRGKQDFAHDVDAIIEVDRGVATSNGRFGVAGRLDVFE